MGPASSRPTLGRLEAGPTSPCLRVCLVCLVFLAGCGQAPEACAAGSRRAAGAPGQAGAANHRPRVGQPGFIDAYEQTAMYAKLAGYIQKWNVDIGDRIKKDQVIAEIFIPELGAEYQQKKAMAAPR